MWGSWHIDVDYPFPVNCCKNLPGISGNKSDSFLVGVWLNQGCPWSLVLFAIFICKICRCNQGLDGFSGLRILYLLLVHDVSSCCPLQMGDKNLSISGSCLWVRREWSGSMTGRLVQCQQWCVLSSCGKERPEHETKAVYIYQMIYVPNFIYGQKLWVVLKEDNVDQRAEMSFLWGSE